MQTKGNVKEHHQVKVMVQDLCVGMQVNELDRPWLGTPFMFHGFRIRSDDEIEMLKKCCDYVFVMRDGSPLDMSMVHARGQEDGALLDALRSISGRGGDRGRYQDTAAVEEELRSARRIFAECHALVSDVFEVAESTGTVDLPRTRGITNEIVDSVLRNPDAFMLLQRLKSEHHYRYRHAVNCCSLAAVFCRFLGFDRLEIQDIAMGAMMLDIGTVRLPGEVLEMESPLSPLLQKLVRHHVNFGLDMLREADDIPPVVRDMIRTHHERLDGKGYPAGLQGEQIPICGRIAAIVDSYDAMVNTRPYRSAMSPLEALCELYKWRDVDFPADLVEKFIQCIGAWPTGSLVELNSGQIGIILSQNRVHGLYPKVLIIMNADKVRYERPHTIDLWEYSRKTHGRVLDIRGVLQPGDIDIDPAGYCQ